ncbi:TetR/AcrR family transcriptional regulator [Streptomyces sp. RKAG290]|uniref:TetR/AcrR family transcriptional regulator n=1 Tax=Streptomyces sp. RKAG290 TaxID=2888348 RepID=UPI0020340DDA|nr:TetR/AcrR family transcriptional regulator [Streptomyces sp. RKAG290]MCM2411371.1 TetR/AcrR family transcriptional regulator [Streptomyces sp. RKAG290]
MTQGTKGKGAAAPTLWDRTRQLAAQEILRTALRLFSQQGYEATTIAQIAREAGVSQRTLFRYFGTKEDLVGGSQDEFVALMTETVREQPEEADVWEALRTAFKAALSVHTSPEDAWERFRLVHHTDSLRAAHLGKRVRCQEELLPLLEARPGPSGAGRAQVRAIIATSFACFDAAAATWVESNGQGDILDLYDQGLAAVRG